MSALATVSCPATMNVTTWSHLGAREGGTVVTVRGRQQVEHVARGLALAERMPARSATSRRQSHRADRQRDAAATLVGVTAPTAEPGSGCAPFFDDVGASKRGARGGPPRRTGRANNDSHHLEGGASSWTSTSTTWPVR